MVEEYLEEAMSCLCDVLPQNWEKVVLYAEIEALHYNIFFYVKTDGKYIQCYQLDRICEVSEEEIDNAIEEWYQLAIKHKQEENWFSYTATIGKDGLFNVDYAYEEAMNLDAWKIEYLI